MYLSRRVLNGNESAIIEVHHLFADTRTTNGVDACEPSFVLAPARESVILLRALKEEMSNRRVV
jgi:hypothetical protein